MSPSISRFRLLLLSVVVGVGAAATAQAQTPEPGGTTVRPAASSVVDFTEVKVTGIPDKPGFDIYIVPKKPKVRNLIELRGNFRPELATSSSRL